MKDINKPVTNVKKPNKNRFALILLLVLVVIAIALTLFKSCSADKAPNTTQNGIVYDDNAIEGGWDNLSPEEIADEMVAIEEERQRWIQKKTAEYANQKYNELLAKGIDEEKE